MITINTSNLRLRYENTYSFLGRLCNEYDPTNWFPDPLTGEGHWMYGEEYLQVELTLASDEAHEVEVYEARLGMFYLTPSVRKHHGLSVEEMEELFFLNTLALNDKTPSFARMDEFLERIKRRAS